MVQYSNDTATIDGTEKDGMGYGATVADGSRTAYKYRGSAVQKYNPSSLVLQIIPGKAGRYSGITTPYCCLCLRSTAATPELQRSLWCLWLSSSSCFTTTTATTTTTVQCSKGSGNTVVGSLSLWPRIARARNGTTETLLDGSQGMLPSTVHEGFFVSGIESIS